MPFSQLHYTSCETGLSGHSGFQFSAMTPDVPREVMPEVEKLTVYEQPRLSRASSQNLDPDRFPTNLLFTYSEVTGFAIIARVRFAGIDFSNRSGNYFAHSLVTSSPADDLQAVFPAELWDAPFWESRQGPAAELPVLTGPLLRGPITREAVTRFLAVTPEHRDFLLALLTAADEAMDGKDRVLLVGPDSDTVCHWIAAVSYLLGPELARNLTFSTYSHDPRRCSTHIVGTVPEAGPFRPDAIASYRVFDPKTWNTAGVLPSAAASLLVRIGIGASARLWDLANSLGAPDEPSLSRWFPILASAALMLDCRLLPDELGEAIDWLANDGTPDAGRLTSAVRAALDHPVEQLTTARQQQLVRLGQRADSLLADASSTLAGSVERETVTWALRRARQGHPPGEGFALQTQSAIGLAANECSQILQTCEPPLAMQLLAWVSSAGVQPDPAAVRQAGRRLLRSGIPRDNVLPSLEDIAALWPDLRAGMVAGLATLPGPQRDAVLADAISGVFRRADFAEHPELCEEWIVASVHQHRMTATASLEEIVKLRRASRRAATVDEALLVRLWSDRSWTPAEAADLLNRLEPDALDGTAIADRLTALVSYVPDTTELADWLDFITGLDRRLPAGRLPDDQMKLAAELSQAADMIRTLARRDQGQTDQAIEGLVSLYGTCSPGARPFLDHHVPPLLPYHSRLAAVLYRCPAPLLSQFCSYARNTIIHGDRELVVFIAAHVFVAVHDLRDNKQHGKANYIEDIVLMPTLPDWKRSEINAVGHAADQIVRHGGRLVDGWYTQNTRRSRLFRWRGI
jgi:hypothetical protein